MKSISDVVHFLEELAKKVKDIDDKLDQIRTNHAISVASDIAVLKTKVNRLESIIYGCIAAIGIEGLALIVSYLKHG